EGLFVVLVGRLDVLKSVASARVVVGAESSPGAPVEPIARLLGTLGPGGVFGEMSLLDEAPAMATVRTRSRSWGLVLPRAEFVGAGARHRQVREQREERAGRRREENRVRAEEMDPGERRVEPI